jgi:hypothetical protein
MSDQKVIPLLVPDLPVDTVVFCAAQAEAIRVLGRRIVRDVIDIGQRLGEVHDKLAKRGGGHWTQWLHSEFGWHHTTAAVYIEIAGAFGGLVSRISSETTIDIGALRLLSHEAVPQEIRVEAIDKAVDQPQARFRVSGWPTAPTPVRRLNTKFAGRSSSLTIASRRGASSPQASVVNAPTIAATYNIAKSAGCA